MLVVLKQGIIQHQPKLKMWKTQCCLFRRKLRGRYEPSVGASGLKTKLPDQLTFQTVFGFYFILNIAANLALSSACML